MKIYFKNFEELILSLICICGEVKESYLFSKFEDETSVLKNYSYNYAKRTLRSMDKEQQLINKKEYRKLNAGDKYLRLSSISGDEACRNISEELMPHFELMAGDANNRYKGTVTNLRRKRDVMFLVLNHLLDGIMVDYFTLEYLPQQELIPETEYRKTIFDEKGNVLHPKELLQHLEKNDVCYFTSNVLRDATNKAASIYKGNSQYTGVLMAPPLFYICYYIPYPEYTWTSTEEQLKLILTGIANNVIGKSKAAAPAAIFYLQNEEIYNAYVNFTEDKKSKRKGRRTYPPEVYDKGFLLPIEEKSCRRIRELLLIEGGEKQLNEVVLGENYITGQEYDGIIKGCKIYSLLLSDYCKMERIKEKVKEEDSIIIIHSWQESTMKKYFGEQTRMVVLSDEEFERYFYEAQNM